MSTAPVKTSLSESVEQQFRRLQAQWKEDTLVLSDPYKIMGHPAMRAIIAMGDAVVPIILRELESDSSLLVWALPELTGLNLAPPSVENGVIKWNIAYERETWLRPITSR